MAGFNPNTINLKAGMDVSGIATSVQKMQQHLGKVDKSVNSMRRSFNNLGFAIAGAFSTAVIGRGLESAISNASDLNETISKTGEIFGDAAKQIEVFAQTAADRLGLSKQEAMDAASTFAIFGKSAGLSGDELVNFSKRLVNLSADLASFYNTSPQEAVVAIGAALRGESEPIRRYGVLLNDATLKQIAFDAGIRDTIKGSLTPQEKVLAANLAIIQQTSDAQGDFERTADGAANATRRLKAQAKDLSAELGETLLPSFVRFLQFTNKHIKRISDGWHIMTTLLSNNWKVMVNRINIQFSALVQSILKGVRTLLTPGLGFLKVMGFDFADDARKNLNDTIKAYDDHIAKLSKRKWKSYNEVAGAFFSSQDMDFGGGQGGTGTMQDILPDPAPIEDKANKIAHSYEKIIVKAKSFATEVPKTIEGGASMIVEHTDRMLQDINRMTEAYIEGALVDIFSRIGEGIAGAATDVEDFGSQMLASFGSFLQQMGAMIISYGVAMDAFKESFKNPYAAIAAGAALVAIGAAIKKTHENKMGSASPSGYSGVPAQGGQMGYNFETRIDGYDLVLVQGRNQRLMNRRG